jgi:hypothetical protein
MNTTLTAERAERHQPIEGDYLQPDGSHEALGENIIKDDGWKDSMFPGCQFRFPRIGGKYMIAINLTPTGKPRWLGRSFGKKWSSRVKIEWVGDCEPSTFSLGTLYHD